MQPVEANRLNPIYNQELNREKLETDVKWLKIAQTISVIAVLVLATPPIVYASMFGAWWMAPAGSFLATQLMLWAHGRKQPQIQEAEKQIEVAKEYERLPENPNDMERRIQAHINLAKEMFEQELFSFKQAIKYQENVIDQYQRPEAIAPNMADFIIKSSKNDLHIQKQKVCEKFLSLCYLTYLKHKPKCEDSFEQVCSLRYTETSGKHDDLSAAISAPPPFVIFKDGDSLSLDEVYDRASFKRVKGTVQDYITPAQAPVQDHSQNLDEQPELERLLG